MSALAEKYAKDGLVVLAVNAWDEPKNKIADFVKKNALKQKVLLNGGGVFRKTYKLKAIPTVFWIDAQGIIVDTDADFNGPGPLERKTARLVERRGRT